MSTDPDVQGWSRRRLLAMVAALATTAVVLIASLVYAIITAVSGHSTDSAISSGSVEVVTFSTDPAADPRGDQYRDRVAAAAMLSTDRDDLIEQPAATSVATTVVVPPATSSGPAGVPTGFTHTPEGAVGQLAAIDTTVLTAMSTSLAADVLDAWSLPGAVSVDEWEMSANIRAFHTQAGTTETDATVAATAVPVAAQVKGVDGPDWVLACVLYDVQAEITTTARIGYGRCERMQWADGRWMIGPGEPPAPAPSTWPGSERSIQAGWHPWLDANDTNDPSDDVAGGEG